MPNKYHQKAATYEERGRALARSKEGMPLTPRETAVMKEIGEEYAKSPIVQKQKQTLGQKAKHQ